MAGPEAGQRVQAGTFAERELKFGVLAAASLAPRAPPPVPSKTSEIAAASTSRSATQASHSRSAASPTLTGREISCADAPRSSWLTDTYSLLHPNRDSEHGAVWPRPAYRT